MGKRRKDSSSSSSEDDLISSQLKECVAGFELQKKDAVKEVEKISLKFQNSKRPDKIGVVADEDEDENTHVTPEFQEFVGKKLRAKMDDLIELVEVERKKRKKHKKRSKEPEKGAYESTGEGFLFFKGVIFNSNNNNNQADNLKEPMTPVRKSKKSKKKKRESSSEEDDDEMRMLNECAVQATNLSKSNADKNLKENEQSLKNSKKSKKHTKLKGESSSDEEDAETMRMLSEAAVRPEKILESSSIKDHKNRVK